MTKTVPCESCGGEGYHGIEEDSGSPYTCYACYGTGLVPVEVEPEPSND